MTRDREWAATMERARASIVAAQRCVDELSRLTDDADVDMRLCFAANALHGPLALLREADAHHRQLELPAVGPAEARP